jgi:hypothetical protein
MFPFYNDFRDAQESPMPGRVLPRASRVLSGNNGVTQDVAAGSALGGGYEQQMGRLLAQSTEAMDRYRQMRDRPVDYTQLQELAKQRGIEGEDAMLNALAAQFAGPQYQGLQGALLKRSMATRDPIKTARGMVTAEGGFVADPDALRADEIQRAGEDARFYDQQYGRVVDASERAQQRRDEIRRREEEKERDRDLQRNLPFLVAAARGSGGGVCAQPVTIMRDGKPVVVDARTNRVIGDAPPNPQNAPKPLPAAALRIQDEAIEQMMPMGGLNNRIDRLLEDLGPKGNLRLGVVLNQTNRALNATGISTPQSRAYEDLKTNLEQFRNGILMLHKGVQTEGDAQRAMNQIVQNISDREVVAQALKRLRELNDDASRLQTTRINTVRREYGAAPMDFAPIIGNTGRLPAPGVIGGGNRSQSAAGSPVLPTMDALNAELRRREAEGR